MRYFPFVLLYLISSPVFSQLGFCEGSKGDPIFQENFNSSAELPPGTTNYTFVNNTDPQDGQYTISDEIGYVIDGWHSNLPQTTVSNGNALIVNADFTSGQFYRTAVSGLCENTSYEFSAYLINILSGNNNCEGGGIPINVTFEIWDESDTELLAEGSTGDIFATINPEWDQYALTFRTEPGQNSVILKMFNNGEGGCGNDLAIDDITFSSCGDLTEITTPDSNNSVLNVCEADAPISVQLLATPDFSVYDRHAYQWQESENNEDWEDIAGANSAEFNTPPLINSRYYRVKVAEDEVNLNNNLCSSASEAFFIDILETPMNPISNGDKIVCGNQQIPQLSVSVENDESVNWYSSENGGESIAENSTSFTPTEAGIYYAEAVKTGFNCEASERTAVELSIFDSPEVEDEILQICEESGLELNAGVDAETYLWNSGETTREINIDGPGNFSVLVTNENGCSAEKNFEVTGVDIAEIEEVISEDNTVRIIPAQEGEFEYSLDGNNFQDSPEFEVSGGIYTAYMRDKSGCNTVSMEFPHVVIPKFITPNADGYNDTFRINGLEYFSASQISIFDRYGKLLKTDSGENFSWDGTLKGRSLPSDDYWYELQIEDYPAKKGNFTLKR